MWKTVFEKNFPPAPGGVLAFFGGIQPLTDFSATYDITMRLLREEGSDTLLYNHFLHLWPSVLRDRNIPAEFRESSAQDSIIIQAGPGSLTKYIESVQFIPLETCDGDALLAELENTPASSSIYLHRAEIYRSSSVGLAPSAVSQSLHGLPIRMGLTEDMTSEHAERLVQGALRIAAIKRSIIILSFESSGFSNESLPVALAGEKDFAVINLDSTNPQARLRTAFRHCLDNSATMTVLEIIKHFDLAGAQSLDTALCRAAVFSAKGISGLAWQTIEPYVAEILASDICSNILFSGGLAYLAGKGGPASLLLERAAKLEPQPLESLLSLHTLSEQVHGIMKAQEVLGNLEAGFPNDLNVKGKRLRFYLSMRNFVEARELAIELSDDYLVALCDVLSADRPAIKQFLDSARDMEEEDRALRDLALEAQWRGKYGAAWRFLRACQSSEEVVRQRCKVLTSRLLRGDKYTDSFLEEISRIVTYVAQHPGQLDSRFALERMIEDDLEYSSAVSLLVVLMDREAERLHYLTKQKPATNECEWIKSARHRDTPDDQSLQILLKVVEALPRNLSLLPGEGTFPEDFHDKATPKMLFDWLYLLQIEEFWADEEKIQTPLLILHAIMLLASHLNDPTSDAVAFRYMVMAQWKAGKPQESRDLAESALMNLPPSQPEFRQWRLACGWLCLAEAFQRSHNPLSALLHLVLCLTSVRDTIPSMKGAKEIFRMCIRVARDIHVLPLAMKYIGFEREVIHRYNVEVNSEYQLFQLEHVIRTMLALDEGSLDDLQALVQQGFRFLEADDKQPEAMLSTLAMLFNYIKINGEAINVDHQERFERHLELVSPNIRELILSQVDGRQTEDTLRGLALRVGDSRSSDDLRFQGRPLRVAAERAIAQSCSDRDACLYFLASAILTQPTLSMALKNEVGTGLELNKVNKWLYRYVDGQSASQEQIKDVMGLAAKSMDAKRVSYASTLDLSIQTAIKSLHAGEQAVIFSRDGNGGLYSLCIERHAVGEVHHLSPEVWNPAKYREWCKTYPYGYGSWVPASSAFVDDNVTAQDVIDSLDGLRPVGWEAGAHNIVVLDAGLFGFPFNLVPCEEGFSGQLYRISCVPSLAWLIGARGAERKICGNLPAAWLGVPGQRDLVLELLSSKIDETLRTNGFEVVKSDRPVGMSGAPLAVAAAHGGLGDLSQFITITTDFKLDFNPRELARFFKDCTCVVLLICSAGRSDEKRHTGETCSLVTELFECGVQSILAPVWPLHIDVAEIWLREFLRLFTSGDTVMNASFAAGNKVAERFPNPCAWAAMHLYGDGSVQL